MNEKSDDKREKFLTKGKIRKLILNIFIIIFFVTVFRLFLVETIIVSSVFMESTVSKGDYVLINKSVYKITTPEKLPFLNRKFAKRNIYDVSEPQRGDLLYLKMMQPNFYNLKNLLSRCVGLPGDTLMITDKKLFINGEKMGLSGKLEYSRNYSIPFGVEEKEFYFGNRGWNQDNFGPVIVPRKDIRIKLSVKNIDFYKKLILQDDRNNFVRIDGERIFINNLETKHYRLKNNYYFVLGDNRELAIDSRYIGFIKEKNIVGKAEFVYWSVAPDKDPLPFKSVRWGRIFHFLN
ncbi:MAG: signal peptidase I [Rhodothermaceae bacterium]